VKADRESQEERSVDSRRWQPSCNLDRQFKPEIERMEKRSVVRRRVSAKSGNVLANQLPAHSGPDERHIA
jgi:hypothetical protein